MFLLRFIWIGLSWAEPHISPEGVPMKPCGEERSGMVCIPGGAFIRGTAETHTCEQSENRRRGTQFGPTQVVWVQTFYIDKTEVTYGAYQACLKEKKCMWAKPSYSDFDRPEQPMMGASWYAAQKYCQSQGKRLPTEAEWEKAARGPEGDPTPFGLKEVSCDEAVIRDGRGRSCGVQKKGSAKRANKGRVWEVAKKPAGHYGLFDMVGNAEEWVSDWFTSDLAACGADCAGTDPQGPCAGQKKCPGHPYKMVKGGSWYWPASHATGWHRRPHLPSNKPYHHFGFRCASDID